MCRHLWRGWAVCFLSMFLAISLGCGGATPPSPPPTLPPAQKPAWPVPYDFKAQREDPFRQDPTARHAFIVLGSNFSDSRVEFAVDDTYYWDGDARLDAVLGLCCAFSVRIDDKEKSVLAIRARGRQGREASQRIEIDWSKGQHVELQLRSGRIEYRQQETTFGYD